MPTGVSFKLENRKMKQRKNKTNFTFLHLVSRIKLVRQQIGQLIPDSPQGIENIRYTVEHIEVFKVRCMLLNLLSSKKYVFIPS